ncbi:MAG: hypothetical protein NTZ67_01985 [Gammaproteobacteria bacterium]|nr:hypothetical protein [Gammaproteobacteria bacterium]
MFSSKQILSANKKISYLGAAGKMYSFVFEKSRNLQHLNTTEAAVVARVNAS